MKRFLLPLFTAFFCDSVVAAETDWIKVSGYLEAYYVHDFRDGTRDRPDFIFSHDISGTPTINLAMVKTALQTTRTRANLALGAGSYMRANYAMEPPALRHLMEANVGYKISKRKSVWLDIGVMPSHIGIESALGAENWTLTRSILTDNSPYFETGAKLSYASSDGEWTTALFLLNGWQRIKRPQGNTTPSIGHQITYRASPRLSLNSSSFIGNDKTDRERRIRYFHNFYGQYGVTERLSLIAGLDVGAEQKRRNSSSYDAWFSPIVVAQYHLSDQSRVVFRAEHYDDRSGVIIDSGTPNGFRTTSLSVNIDFRQSEDLLLRAELRAYQGKDRYFGDGVIGSTNSLVGTVAFAVSF
jgi:hypothetical protein